MAVWMYIVLFATTLTSTAVAESAARPDLDVSFDRAALPALVGACADALPMRAEPMSQSSEASRPPALVDPRPPFGSAGSSRWLVQLGGGSNFHEDGMGLMGFGYSYFMADDVSIDLELNGLHFAQVGAEAAGINVNMMFRWHYFHDPQRTWSLYADLGSGLLLTTRDVPHDGSSFNFTPQMGVGASWDVKDGVRMLLGLRWHHVSNARLYQSNPGRDTLFLYAQLSFPF